MKISKKYSIFSLILNAGFYNTATDALLNQYGTEVSAIRGSATWRSIIVYKNVLRATDNIGVNAAWVIKFYLKGTSRYRGVVRNFNPWVPKFCPY